MTDMNITRYQIAECGADFGFAGSKAPEDVALIAEKLGYKKWFLRMRSTAPGAAAKAVRQAGYAKDWERILWFTEPESVVLLQHPFHYPQLTRERSLITLKNRRVRFVCLVHDVEALRGYRDNEYYKREMAFMLKIADVLIVPNKTIKHFFVKEGFQEERIVELEIFDYLHDEENSEEDIKSHPAPEHLPAFSRKVNIAGNLYPEKNGYAGELDQVPSLKFELYGNDPRGWIHPCDNIVYKGRFAPSVPERFLTSGIGLVWDGDSIGTCSGPAGEYLRYNSPHKLSLYLSCGMPVAVWKEAAAAEFVEKYKTGILISSLYELEEKIKTLTEEEYTGMQTAACRIAGMLRNGAYTENAIQKAERTLFGGNEYDPI